MKEVAPSHGVVRFSAFEVDLRIGEVRKHGFRIRLQDQPFHVLQILLEHPGELVTREELQHQIWPADTFVDFEKGLNNAIRKLRDALGDSAEQPRFIETLSRRGYRFIAPVNGNGTAAASVPQEAPLAPNAAIEPRPWQRRNALKFLAVLAVAALLFGVPLGLNSSKIRLWLSRGSGSPPIHSLAVLPFWNLSDDPAQEYFSDGMSDALITELAQIGSLKVISRTSSMQYKQTKKTLPQIARELNVDGIIEGTVQRSGDRVRITAQLIQGPADKHLWANSYERDMRDMFALERDVAEDIARQIQAQLTTAKQTPLVAPRPVDPKVLDAYLQGNYHLQMQARGGGDGEKKVAAKYFQQAIDADPHFAVAYIGLANAHDNLLRGSVEDKEIMRKAAERALELEPTSSEGRVILAGLKWSDFDWTGAEEGFRRAIALNPSSAAAHDALGTLLVATGQPEEGLREGEIAKELDPNQRRLSMILEMRGEYDRAIELLRRMVESSPGEGVTHYNLYRLYLEKGMHKEAVQELERANLLFGFPETAHKLHRAFAVSGYRGAMQEWAKALEYLQSTNELFLPENLAAAYAATGDNDRAFYWLTQAYEHRDMVSHDWGLGILKADHMLDPLHSDSRFKDLLRRIGLPQ